jgi:predicted RNA-binding Zn-ribbon protein involved in translation (DUF1610 family)
METRLAILDCNVCDGRRGQDLASGQVATITQTGAIEIFCPTCGRKTFWRLARCDRRSDRDRRLPSGVSSVYQARGSQEPPPPELAGVQSLAGELGGTLAPRTPADRRQQVQRNYRRLPLAMPVRIRTLKPGGFDEVTQTVNACRGGIYITSDKPYEKNMLLMIAMNEADMAVTAALEQKARVARVDRSPGQSLYGVAIEFVR